MADKDKNQDFEFDFSGGDWEDEQEAGAGKAAAKAPAAEDPFGAGAFADDADPFSVQAEESSEDPFAMAAEDPFASGDEDPFSFQDMPTPGANPVSAAMAGNPDDEFGDLDDDAFAEADGFKGGTSLFQDEEPAEAQDEADPFADHAEDDEQAADPFAEEEEADEAEGKPAPAEKPSARRRSLVMPLALAASAAFVGYVAYSTVLPMLSRPAQPPATPVAEAPAGPSFPTALPGQPGGLELPVAVAPQTAPAAPLPSVPAAAPPVELPPQPTALPLPAASKEGAKPSALTDLPVVAAAPLQDAPQAVKQPDAAPVLAGPQSPVDELVGGEERGGIDAMKGKDGGQKADVQPGGLEAIEARLSEVEAKVDRLADRIERQIAAGAPSAGKEAAAEKPASALDGLVPPLKPAIVEGATLKGVSRGLAWISTASGVVEVRKGDSVPNGGKVVAIRQYGGNWIVVTTDGIVVQ